MLTPMQALNIMFQAARGAKLSAEDHAKVQQAATVLDKALPKEEAATATKPKNNKK